MLQVLTESNFKNTVSEGITVVDFYADWCGPCKMLTPVLESVSKKVEAKICKVNVDESRELAKQFGVKGIPFLVVMKNGKMVEQSVGLKDENTILEMISRHANTQV
jgi:thioredoxin 1|tara:strand:+ start:848 stop:1165 length:318 start_codon:yes stop_codon:yes gene_type:complete